MLLQKKGQVGPGQELSCRNCAVVSPKVWPGQKYCQTCGTKRNNERVLAHKRRRGRKDGTPYGRRNICCVCGDPTTGKSGTKYCDECRARAVAGHRKVAVDKYQVARGRRLSGTPIYCARCNCIFPSRGGLNVFCLDCKGARKKERRRLRRIDPKQGLSARMGGALRYALKRKKQRAHWEDIVGYTAAELMIHIERQFLPGMSWVNFDRWHIDHIVPVAAFNFSSSEDKQFKACWALTNLRPLWADENIKKNAQRTHLI